MPDVEANRRQWDEDYAWPLLGDEWSAPWGNADAEWYSTLRPRLRRWLPAPTILEIAPGYGRWTQYLVGCCERYVGVDLSPQAVEACRRRFDGSAHAEFHANDGRSLAVVDDATVDLAFSFDSLVHVEDDVVAAYVKELARVLSPDGIAFLHHSNLAACRPVGRPWRAALRVAERALRRGSPGFDYWRGETMSANRLEEIAAQAGLACIGQELVNWLGGRLLDCISILTPRGSRWERTNVVVRNPHFMSEAASSARAALVHSSLSPPPPDSSTVQHLGPLTHIVSASIGPWGISVVRALAETEAPMMRSTVRSQGAKRRPVAARRKSITRQP